MGIGNVREGEDEGSAVPEISVGCNTSLPCDYKVTTLFFNLSVTFSLFTARIRSFCVLPAMLGNAYTYKLPLIEYTCCDHILTLTIFTAIHNPFANI